MTDKELIKQEIERRIDLYSIAEKDDSTFARMGELSSLIDFINSLPEESGCEVNFTTKSEDLEEEYDNYFKKHEVDIVLNPYTNCKDIASHFAEWQEKKMLGIAEAFYQQGRYEQKQKMLKDTVNGEYWIGEIHLDTPIIQGYDDGDRIKFIPIKEIQQ